MPSSSPIGISMGDPSGIGPEIIVACLARRSDFDSNFIVFGCPNVIRRAIRLVGADMTIRQLESTVSEAIGEQDSFAGRTIHVIPTSVFRRPPAYGEVAAASGHASFVAIEKAIGGAMAGQISGIVTAPINKEALFAAGIEYPGHTEILADYSGSDRVAMMLANNEIKTVLVTIHCSLQDAINHVTFDSVLSTIRFAHQGAKAWGSSKPKVAVAGLNPHAGEGGLFGREEIEIIAPAISAARREGINAQGPLSADTVYMLARKGRYDVVVSHYHDQALIPIKYLGLEKGVNITLGLPFVRTSPDHGTAYDIAGKGIADSTPLETAILSARRLIDSNERHPK